MRVVTCAVVALVLVALGIVQFASDAFFASAAAPGSVPRRVPVSLALRVYRVLDRIAPAEYVEATLATYDLQRGDTRGALHHAVLMPPSPARSEILGRIALARGDRTLAREYFFAAPDIDALQREVRRVARTDPVRAYAFELRVRNRLSALQTHPDAVAEAYWIMGSLATSCARREAFAREHWLRRALANDIAAVRLSPLSEKYLLAAASAENNLGDSGAALRLYRRVHAIDPDAVLP